MNPTRKPPNTDTYSGRFATRLRKLREKAGLTLQEVAEALGISYKTVYSWEAGHTEPKFQHHLV